MTGRTLAKNLTSKMMIGGFATVILLLFILFCFHSLSSHSAGPQPVSGAEIELTCSGPSCLFIELDNLDFYQRNQPALDRIVAAAGSKAPSVVALLPCDQLEQDGDSWVSLVERYSEHSWGLLAVFGEETVLQEGQHRSCFERISKAAGDQAGDAFFALPVEWLTEHDSLIADLAESAGSESPRAFEALATIPEQQDESDLVALLDSRGSMSWGLIAAFGEQAYSTSTSYSDFFDELHRLTGAVSGRSCSKLTPALLSTHDQFLLEIATSAGVGTPEAFASLRLVYLDCCPDVLTEVAKAAGPQTGPAFDALPNYDPQAAASTVIAVAQATGPLAGEALLSFRRAPTQSMEAVEAIALSSSPMTGHALASMKPIWLKDHEETLKALAAAAGPTTGLLFDDIDIDLLTDRSEDLVRFVERYRGASAGLLKTYGHGALDENPEHGQLALDSYEQLGITHLHRYLDESEMKGEGADLLQECLRNLNPDPSDTRPLALAVLTEYDWNGGFEKFIPRILPLTEGYRLVIVEAADENEAFEAINQIGSLHGVEADGTATKGLQLLILAGHGNQHTLSLGYSLLQDRATRNRDLLMRDPLYLDVNDADQFEESGRFLGRDSNIVMVSCATGSGGAGEANLSTVIHTAIPHATVFAPKQATSTKEFLLDEDGHLIGVRYACGASQTLKLPADSQASPRPKMLNRVL